MKDNFYTIYIKTLLKIVRIIVNGLSRITGPTFKATYRIIGTFCLFIALLMVIGYIVAIVPPMENVAGDEHGSVADRISYAADRVDRIPTKMTNVRHIQSNESDIEESRVIRYKAFHSPSRRSLMIIRNSRHWSFARYMRGPLYKWTATGSKPRTWMRELDGYRRYPQQPNTFPEGVMGDTEWNTRVNNSSHLIAITKNETAITEITYYKNTSGDQYLKVTLSKQGSPALQRLRRVTEAENGTEIDVYQLKEIDPDDMRRPKKAPSITVTETIGQSWYGLERLYTYIVD